jgi:hypothetical protein
MNRLARWTTLATTLGLLSAAGSAIAEEETISVKHLPGAVIKALKAKFPRAAIKKAAEEEEDDETVYEVSLEFKGRSYDVTLEADGTFVEIEKKLTTDELPAAVLKTLAARYPKAMIEKAEEITTGKGGEVRYEVVLKAEVAFTASGKVVKAEEEEEDEEDEGKAEVKAKKSSKDDDDDKAKGKDDDEREHKAKAKKGTKGRKNDKDDDDDDDEKD